MLVPTLLAGLLPVLISTPPRVYAQTHCTGKCHNLVNRVCYVEEHPIAAEREAWFYGCLTRCLANGGTAVCFYLPRPTEVVATVTIAETVDSLATQTVDVATTATQAQTTAIDYSANCLTLCRDKCPGLEYFAPCLQYCQSNRGVPRCVGLDEHTSTAPSQVLVTVFVTETINTLNTEAAGLACRETPIKTSEIENNPDYCQRQCIDYCRDNCPYWDFVKGCYYNCKEQEGVAKCVKFEDTEQSAPSIVLSGLVTPAAELFVDEPAGAGNKTKTKTTTTTTTTTKTKTKKTKTKKTKTPSWTPPPRRPTTTTTQTYGPPLPAPDDCWGQCARKCKTQGGEGVEHCFHKCEKTKGTHKCMTPPPGTTTMPPSGVPAKTTATSTPQPPKASILDC